MFILQIYQKKSIELGKLDYEYILHPISFLPEGVEPVLYIALLIMDT